MKVSSDSSPFLITSDGWLTPARQAPSPHFNARPASTSIRLLVIHNISLPPNEFGGGYIEPFFLGQLDSNLHPYFKEIATLEVSAHLLIDREGSLTQFVSFLHRAWHAGHSSYQGVANCNDFSVGIELEGCDSIAYTEAQYQVLADVTKALKDFFPELKDLVGHCDIAPGRKTDPGESFDWKKFRALMDL